MKMLFILSIASGYGGAERSIKFILALGHRCHIYVRDLLWFDHVVIVDRFTCATLLTPAGVVAERQGHLLPLYLERTGAMPFSIIPDLIQISDGYSLCSHVADQDTLWRQLRTAKRRL